jgi:hypothetical protein
VAGHTNERLEGLQILHQGARDDCPVRSLKRWRTKMKTKMRKRRERNDTLPWAEPWIAARRQGTLRQRLPNRRVVSQRKVSLDLDQRNAE